MNIVRINSKRLAFNVIHNTNSIIILNVFSIKYY